MTNAASIAYEPLSPAVQANPYPYYLALRNDDPVHFIESLQAFAVSRHADARRVMHDAAAFSSEAMATLVGRPVAYATDAGVIAADDSYPVSIIGTDDEVHSRLRHIVNRGFTPRRIAQLEDEIRRIARTLVSDLVAREVGDLQTGFAVPLPTAVIAQMLGLSTEQSEDFRRWSEDMVRAVFEPIDAAEQATVARSSDQMGEWLEMVIAARSGRMGEDLISVLMRAEIDGGALTHEEMTVFVFTLLIAGTITTAYLIGTIADILASDPTLLSALRTGASRFPAIVEEALRYDAPVQMMFRTATTNVNIGAATIPKGATVVALLGAANRDERVFHDPDRFDPSRDPSEHLAFGHGVHHCLGAALARLEARIAIEELVAHAPHLKPAGNVEHVSSMVFRGPTCLPLRYV